MERLMKEPPGIAHKMMKGGSFVMFYEANDDIKL